MRITDLELNEALIYKPSGAVVVVENVSPWNVTLRNLDTLSTTVVNNEVGLELYSK